jgi:hypothetical protein
VEHINWINKSNIHLVRINLKYDSFLSDINLYQSRLVKFDNEYFIRYKKSNKIFWYSTYIHKISKDYYHITIDLIDDDKLRNRLNRKYIPFNREWSLNLLLK